MVLKGIAYFLGASVALVAGTTSAQMAKAPAGGVDRLSDRNLGLGNPRRTSDDRICLSDKRTGRPVCKGRAGWEETARRVEAGTTGRGDRGDADPPVS